MFGQDPRSLRPADRDDMNTRFKLVHKRSKRGRNGEKSTGQEVGVLEVKGEPYTPAFSDITAFGDLDLRSPQQDSIHSFGSDFASPGSTLDYMSPTGPMSSAHPREDMEAPFRAPVRNDTVFSTATQMSTDSVRKLKSGLNLTTVFAKQVVVLMKRMTISNSDTAAFPSPQRAPSDIPAHHLGYSGLVPHPGLTLPGDFIVARKYVQRCSQHSGSCWCVIFDDISEVPDSFYITSAEETWCDRACDVQSGKVDTSSVDYFGNTPLHFFASLESDVGMNMTLYLIGSDHVNPLATNTGGQTFLHLLSAAWFARLHNKDGPLSRLLDTLLLRYGNLSDALFYRDVYGRTFFHHLARYVHDPKLFGHFSEHYTKTIPRDAFGVMPTSYATERHFGRPQRSKTGTLSPLSEDTKEEDAVITRNTHALFIVQKAYDDRLVEDAEGNNGLHCLAEVDFSLETSMISAPSSPISEKKRKRGQSATSTEHVPTPIERRAGFLWNLLDPKLGETVQIDVNHYNKAGHTPLMAFATHLTDAADKSGEQTGRIIDDLLEKRACIDMRNRQGETALLMAARAGNKNVVSKLVERGANLYTRDKNGRGIMAVLEAQIEASKGRGLLADYGRLEALKAMLGTIMSKKGGGHQDPTLLDEWREPPQAASA